MWDAITSMQVHGQQPPRPIDSYTKLLLHFGGADESTTFTDSGNTGHTVTDNGDAQIDTAYKKFGTGSGLFDGTGDYLSIPDNADWNFGSDPFTIDFWVRAVGAVDIGGICGSYDDEDNNYRIAIDLNGALSFRYYTGGVQNHITSSSEAAADNTWTHIAVIRGWGSVADAWALTVNGVAEDTDTIAVDMPDLADTFNIGKAEHSAGTYEFEGHIDEFRISKGIARWTSNFNAPIRAY